MTKKINQAQESNCIIDVLKKLNYSGGKLILNFFLERLMNNVRNIVYTNTFMFTIERMINI